MRKYSITYKPVSDPTKKEQDSLISALTAKQVKVLDEIPGVVSVSGQVTVIKEVLANYSDWVCTPNLIFSFNI
jgi:hypothetical protein